MSEQKNSNTQSPVYIIGDTPLAYFLTAKFSLAGQACLIIGERDSIKNYDTFVFKDETKAQKDTIRALKTSVMHNSPSMVILCMDSNKIKSGLIYVSPSKITQIPVVSFCHTSTPDILENVIKQPIIPAYFDGWLTIDQENKLTYHGSSEGLRFTLSQKHPYFETLQNTFSKLEIDFKINSNATQNFWDYFIPYAACSLFSLKNSGHISEIAKRANYRQDLNNILDEIISIAPQNIKIAKEQIINNIYVTPKNYIYPAADTLKNSAGAEFSFISETIQNRPEFKPSQLPVITDIIKNESRLLSSVENRDFTLNKSK